MAKRIFSVRGMDCAEEVEALKGTVGRLAGVERLDFNLLNGTLSVTAAETVSDDAIRQAARRAGLDAEPVDEAAACGVCAADEHSGQHRGRLLACAASGLFLAAGLVVHAVLHRGFWHALTAESAANHAVPLLTAGLYLAAVIFGGWHVLPRAVAALRALRPDMNLLMTIAVAGALFIGQWFEAAMVAFLFAFALLLESWCVARARHAIRALTELTPDRARYIRPLDGELVEAPVAEVPVGVTVLVRPGEKIPLDGVVLEGQTTVNEAPITGESQPAPKVPGQDVFAGSINNDGAISLRVTKLVADTTLARIIRMVEEAEERRAPVEQWVDRFARYYTPAMMVFAILVAVVPPLVAGGNWGRWFYEALVMLVVACPCALVISTPVGVVAGLTAAARQGVLIKGGVHLETASKLKIVAVDKTGTITRGKPEVYQIVPFSGHTETEVLARAAALEAESEHPLSRAIRTKAAARGIEIEPVRNFQVIKGKGAEGWLNGRLFWIGSHRLLEERGAETPAIHKQAEALEDAAHSVVAVGNDNHVCGLLSVADGLREQAARVVTELKALGIRRVVMLTGDNEGTAAAVARQAGVDEYQSELLPEDKLRVVRELVDAYHHVAMVGDGVNDAPAMAASSLGIAMGAAGTDAAIETADIALMADDLTKLPWLIRHARRVMATIQTNIVFALGLKAAVMLLALAGLATLWMAIAADMGASLLVIFYSLRLLRT